MCERRTFGVSEEGEVVGWGEGVEIVGGGGEEGCHAVVSAEGVRYGCVFCW